MWWIRIEDSTTGLTFTGRELFELWIYGGILHDDHDKELTLKSLAMLSGLVRAGAHNYLVTLLQVAAYAARAARLVLDQE